MPFAKLAIAALAASLAGACTNHARSDSIAFHAGESQAANRAVHVIDPWPAYASDTRIPHDAERVARAVERYRTREPDKQEAVSTGVSLK